MASRCHSKLSFKDHLKADKTPHLAAGFITKGPEDMATENTKNRRF